MSVSQEQRRVRELVMKGQSKGFLTNDEVNRALPSGYLPEQLDELLTMLKLAGIRVIDREEAAERRKNRPKGEEEADGVLHSCRGPHPELQEIVRICWIDRLF